MKVNLSNFESNKQDILTGSSKIYSKENKPFDKQEYMAENMHENLAYKSYIKEHAVNDLAIDKNSSEYMTFFLKENCLKDAILSLRKYLIFKIIYT